jgi:broad specificity phosphatase PhoE
MDATDATIALLIRHAHTDAVDHRLVGRAGGVPLSAAGRAQADCLGRAFASCTLAAIYTSPLERALETARALARYQAAPVHVSEPLSEVEFGNWTGKTFAELETLPEWRAFNHRRSTAVVPGGERPIDVQRRIVAALAALATQHAGHTIAVISHADVLRSAVLHYAATPLDLYDRFVISPASVTAVSLSPAGPQLLYVNNSSYAAHS